MCKAVFFLTSDSGYLKRLSLPGLRVACLGSESHVDRGCKDHQVKGEQICTSASQWQSNKNDGFHKPNVRKLLEITYGDMLLSEWAGSYTDALELLSVPVSVFQQAVEGMKSAKANGEKEKEEEKKGLIIEILSIVFAVLQLVGEDFGAAGGFAALAAPFARIGIVDGAAGSAALDLYAIEQNPEQAAFILMGGLLGFEGVAVARNAKGLSSLKDAKRIMESSGSLKKFGKIVADNNNLIASIVKSCRRV